LKQLINSDLPCVLIDINIKTDSNNISIVQIDDFKASCEAVQYLIDNGHTNIVYLNGVKNSTVSVDRLKGYKATLRKNKLLVNEDYIVEADFSEKISIIGFDDIPIAYYLKPGLTTIAQSFYEKGLESAKLIWKQLNNEVKGEVVTLVHQLVIRDSVRKLK
jgi:LacI family transcriptional regulator